MTIDSEAAAAVIRVGAGRGFIVEASRRRLRPYANRHRLPVVVKRNRKMDEDVKEFLAQIREERRRKRAAVTAFVDAAVSGDPTLLRESMEEIELNCAWHQTMRAVAKTRNISEDIQHAFLLIWTIGGDHIRSEVGDDKVLIDALRKLVPPYKGPSRKLYRGDCFTNRKHRTYGLSWSAERDVAECFAHNIYQSFEGGSVLLETIAPLDAIICAVPADNSAHAVEEEYLVDRRRLTSVRVLERYPPKPFNS